MPQSPSTRWTVADVFASARELSTQIDNKMVIAEVGKLYYKLAISEIVSFLNSALDPTYFTIFSAGIVVNNELDISSLFYDRIVFIEDEKAGLCTETTPTEFSSLLKQGFQHHSYNDDIVWMQYGNRIRFKVGSNVKEQGSKFIYYQRQPNYPFIYDSTEFPDLPDKWIPLLVKRIYTYIILQTQNDIPKNLAQEIQLDYQLISAAAGVEVANRLKGKLQVENKE